ncbi:hypothetical protein BD311DRAFT_771305 [Dichomitus squalens]|uniref:Uncharacterized protein n=1 Tax=Dichomitus squalens TaxID=114155 RepID=A0A4Q9M514_9APHY|nr:hypothetical protein BD311DRAFT_771305 [Dichomitus squalens]
MDQARSRGQSRWVYGRQVGELLLYYLAYIAVLGGVLELVRVVTRHREADLLCSI